MIIGAYGGAGLRKGQGKPQAVCASIQGASAALIFLMVIFHYNNI